MNATDIRTPSDFPMPDLHCPTWCAAEHAADWELHVAVGFDTRRIPAAGGGFMPHTSLPIEQWCSLDYFLSSHFAPLVDQPMSGTLDNAGERWRLDLGCGPDEQVHLDLDASGSLTAADVRRMVAHLLNAADMLDVLSQ